MNGLPAGRKNILDRKITLRALVFILIICLMPLVSPPVALFLGILTTSVIGHPFLQLNHKLTRILLQFSVVGLGFGMNVNTALQAGKSGLLFTVSSIVITLLAGYLSGRLLKIDKKTSYLISAGTAICGGSAIAAISPVIRAEEKQISIALGTIFILNSLALFLFPVAGHLLHLSQSQFGIWSAIAIQDTSSVVGAATRYGAEALQIATTVKLTRALWIIPVALISSRIFRSGTTTIRLPYFIGLFILAILVNTYVPVIGKINTQLVAVSKAGLTVTLFLIGSGLSKQVLAAVGLKPVLQGILLWLIISLAGLWAVLTFTL
ncbi:YeiH family protein [Sediminibacterium ginsengisoli]|uniref:Conserved hypothetical integral membrane protein n=1 Tax=Sediminibacterium ginsengisoli TaxID=413434 RepID=A0A1T4R2P9_9BACT|nr:putative sulfate exporter family transporter [Sediminibacterium ginsengisoli]SKA09878.1 conserved hypothetical integral membrane protein [Sediminibacterium ginsengisoli]